MSDAYKVKLVTEVFRFNLGPYIPGPQGPPGPAGGSVITAQAGQNLSSGRAVVSEDGDIFYFDPTNEDHAGRLYGITKTSGLSGQDVQVQIAGQFNETGLGLTPDLVVYAGANGVLTHTPPATGLVQEIGPAIDANTLVINITKTIISI